MIVSVNHLELLSNRQYSMKAISVCFSFSIKLAKLFEIMKPGKCLKLNRRGMPCIQKQGDTGKVLEIMGLNEYNDERWFDSIINPLDFFGGNFFMDKNKG